MPGSLCRRDNIRRVIRFMKLFYDLNPKGARITIRRISQTSGCSRTNSRHWIDAAGFEIPIFEAGKDEYHNRKGPPAMTFSVLGDGKKAKYSIERG